MSTALPLDPQHTPLAIARALGVSLAWPALAAVSLSVAVGGSDVTAMGLLLVACGTMSAYGLDRLIDRRGIDPPALRRVLVVFVAIASLCTAGLACTAWWRFKTCVVLGVIAGAYVPLKRRIPKNVMTTIGWTVATATLPFAERPTGHEYGVSVACVALIMAANTVLCDVPDVAADRLAGVRGIAPFFGARGAALAGAVLGTTGAVLAASVGRWGLASTAAGLAVLGILLLKNKPYSIRFWADGLVTVLPGTMAMLFR